MKGTQMAQRSKTETAMLCAALLVGLSMCGNTAQHMSAGGTAKIATVGGVTAAGAAAGHTCAKVGVKTCLGGGGGGGGDKGKAKQKEETTPQTSPPATNPPATNPPAPQPEAQPAPAPAPQPAPDKGGVPVNGGTTPGGIIVPNAASLGKAIATPMDTGGHLEMPCVAVGLGGVAMSQC